jgi:hypothetical protein
MDKLATHLALHGVLVVTLGAIAGLSLWRSILRNTNVADWHLLHASGTSRGIILIALAAIINLPALPTWQTTMLAWFIIYFVWSSVLAMLVRAICGEPGFAWSGSPANKLVHVLYVTGTIVLFPALLLLAVGLYKALAP